MNDAACLFDQRFQARQGRARGNDVVYDTDFFAFDQVGVVFGKVELLLLTRGDRGFDNDFDTVLHIQLFGLSRYRVVTLPQFSGNAVRQLQALRFRRDDDFAIGELFRELFCGVLGQSIIAVQVEESDADTARQGHDRQVCFKAPNIDGVIFHSNNTPCVLWTEENPYIFIVAYSARKVNGFWEIPLKNLFLRGKSRTGVDFFGRRGYNDEETDKEVRDFERDYRNHTASEGQDPL